MYQINENIDFEEIHPNFLPEQAIKEANRCLYCYDAPCIEGCPVSIDIPNFIQSIRTQNLKRAARIINKANPFGSVCGRVCPVERLCEKKCVVNEISGKPVQIGMLQRYAADYGDYQPPTNVTEGPRVAIVGSGPAGVACARELVRKGYQVTIFESKKRPGGMIAYGVPQYRCPHEITAREINRVLEEGVELRTSTPVNKNVTQLFEMGFKAVFIAVGLTRTSRFKIPGMKLKGVYMGLDFLNRIGAGDPPEVGRKVVVVGGGDTAMDCARSALRLGAERASIMYRRSFVELPADKFEIDEALQEGIIFRTLTQPVALYGDDKGILRAVEAVNIKLGAVDTSGRRRPVPIKGSEHRIACNTFIFATGTEPSRLLKKLIPTAEFIDDKYPLVNPKTFATSIPGVFVGGDVANRGATVVEAVAEGVAAANGIIEYLEKKKKEPEEIIGEETTAETEEPGAALEKAEKAIEEAEQALKVIEKTEKAVEEAAGIEEDEEYRKKREELKRKWKEKLGKIKREKAEALPKEKPEEAKEAKVAEEIEKEEQVSEAETEEAETTEKTTEVSEEEMPDVIPEEMPGKAEEAESVTEKTEEAKEEAAGEEKEELKVEGEQVEEQAGEETESETKTDPGSMEEKQEET